VLGGHLRHYSKHQLKRRHSLLTAHFQYNSFFIRQAAKTTFIKIEDVLPVQDTRCRNVRRHYRFDNTRYQYCLSQRKTTLPSARVFPVLSPSHIKKYFSIRRQFTHFFQIRFNSVLQHLILDPCGSIPPYNTFNLTTLCR
jgi:hypothetical protein